MMEYSKIEDMTKIKYELYVMYNHIAFYPVQVRISVLANYLNL
jgi:hypothetical protein